MLFDANITSFKQSQELKMAPYLISKYTESCCNQHVEDIQELSRSQPTTVPAKYVRDVNERAISTPFIDLQVPEIDMSKLTSKNQLDATHEMMKLTKACQDWGFFQVVNHGIEEGLLKGIEKVANDFFMLPLEEKEKYPMAPGSIQGYGHAFVFSEEQKLDWCNMLALGVEPPFIRNPKLWPKEPYNFGETLEKYSASIRTLCQRLLAMIAQSLGLHANAFNAMFGEAVQAVRMNYYPPCPDPDLVLGLSPHSDGSALTVLQQDMHSVGLQVLHGGSWVPVKPVPDALVINIGDTLEVFTNGRYKSVEHRAVTNREKHRLSIVTFYAPSYDVELGPVPELVSKLHPSVYRRYKHADYNRHYVTNKLQGKKSLEFAKIRN